MVLPSGMRAIWTFAASRKQFDPAKQAAPAVAPDDLFGSPRPEQPASDVWAALRAVAATSCFRSCRSLETGLAEAEGAACGLRLDAAGKCGGRRATRSAHDVAAAGERRRHARSGATGT